MINVKKLMWDIGCGELTAGVEFYAVTPAQLDSLIRNVVVAEREACAKVCDAHTVDDVLLGVGIGQSCAATIRARGTP